MQDLFHLWTSSHELRITKRKSVFSATDVITKEANQVLEKGHSILYFKFSYENEGYSN